MAGREQIIEEAEGLSGFVDSEWDGLEKSYSSKREAIEVAQLQEELDGRKQDRIQRKEYANKIYALLCVYLVVVFTLLFFDGFGLTDLATPVLIAIVTTTTANIIGIFYFVAKYIFHTKE